MSPSIRKSCKVASACGSTALTIPRTIPSEVEGPFASITHLRPSISLRTNPERSRMGSLTVTKIACVTLSRSRLQTIFNSRSSNLCRLF